MFRKTFSALNVNLVAGAGMISVSWAAAQTNTGPALLPMGNVMLRAALATESAGKPPPNRGESGPGPIPPAAWFPKNLFEVRVVQVKGARPRLARP
jgi:hypothetical protein